MVDLPTTIAEGDPGHISHHEQIHQILDNDTDATFQIPTDYSTLQAAIDDLATRFVTRGVTVTLNIESGHALTEGVLFQHGDYSMFRITSDDATVPLDGSFTPVTGVTSVTNYDNDVIAVDNAWGPRLACLIDAAQADVTGLLLQEARMKVELDAGIDNANRYGFVVTHTSVMDAVRARFTGAGYGNRVTTNSGLNAPLIDLSGARGLISNTAALDVSRGSVVNITGDTSDTTNKTNLSGSADRGLAVRRSWVSADSIDVGGAGSNGVRGENGSHISCASLDASNVGQDGIAAFSGTDVAAGDIVAPGCGRRGITSDGGSSVHARNGDLTGAASEGAQASHGSKIDLRDANTRLTSGSDSSDDTKVLSGGIINFNGGTGGTNISVNSLTSNGIIFQ